MPLPVSPPERTTFTDPVSGVPVTRWTNHRGHSHHLYFTNPGWYDGGRRLLLGSDRYNRTNLYSVELATGEITQITDADMPLEPTETSFLFASVNPVRDEAYFWRGPDLLAVDLRTGQERPLYRAPDGMSLNMTNVTADGQFVCTAIYERLGGTEALLRGYVGFEAYWASKPLSQVLRIRTDGGGAEVVFEERSWIGHVNTSPTQPHLLTFCHEGPWDRVDQRMWGLDLVSGKGWKIRPQAPGERIGHEYWFEDGLRVGYHGHTAAGPVYGAIRSDNTDIVEAPFPHDSHHFHSLDLDLVVGDGTRGHPWDPTGSRPYILLWRFREGAFEGPRVLARHRGSAHVQMTHVHPRISPDRAYVVYTSDDTGYGNVYTAELRPFEELPELPAERRG